MTECTVARTRKGFA